MQADDRLGGSPRQVFGAVYSRVQPTPVIHPELIAYSPEMADILAISAEDIRTKEYAGLLAGNKVLPGMDPYAMNYGGHQFGSWAGQLGDGRVINLGEIVGTDNQNWTLQLKGAGLTPYSRTADGRAVLRSSIREFLCSEAMFHLGIPTTRALSLVLTGEQVLRDMFYDGHPELEPGAVVCRVSPSFIRFGNFQIHAARAEDHLVKMLADYTIRYDFAHLGDPTIGVYLEWFDEVCRRTADLLVNWMRVGFVHGVMNTDNMSILGLTIDYGPYGWIDNYDPGWTPNTTDANTRRYVFGNQAEVAHWNLAQLARAILPLVNEPARLQTILDKYPRYYETGYAAMMASKLGFLDVEHSDVRLFADLNALLAAEETDMTIFYRRLASLDLNSTGEKWLSALKDAYYEPVSDSCGRLMISWIKRYSARLGANDSERQSRMNRVNPKYVLRNYLAQTAIDKSGKGDHSLIAELLNVMRRPYDEQLEYDHLSAKRPDWARHRAGCSMLSCSS